MKVWENAKIIISWRDGYWYIYYKHSGSEYKRFSGVPLIVSNLSRGYGLWKS